MTGTTRSIVKSGGMNGRSSRNIPVIKITTEMLRKYLVEYQTINNCGKVTIDNIRRSLSTFFSWLEEEDYNYKKPNEKNS